MEKNEASQASREKEVIFSVLLAMLFATFPTYLMADDEHLFSVFEISDGAKQELVFDQAYFFEIPPPALGRVSTHSDISRWVNTEIDFITDGDVKVNQPNIGSKSLLDRGFMVVKNSLDGVVIVNGKTAPSVDSLEGGSGFFITLTNNSSILQHLSQEASIIYRLANIFGLTTVASLSTSGDPSITSCSDIIRHRYLCDSGPDGPFSIAGKTINHYLDFCKYCTDSDHLILSKISTHFLLRAFDKKTRGIGEDLFRLNRDDFRELDINHRELSDIYLSSLTR